MPVVFLALTLPLLAQTHRTPTPPTSPLQARVERLLAPAVAVGEFSGTILVRKANRDLVRVSRGAAIREFGVPVTASTRFLIGSISKQFTAAAIVLLADEGRLHLDDSLARWLPGFPHADQITVRQLIQHTSGISRDLPGGLATLRQAHTTREMVDLIATDSLRFPPGTSSAYSNNAYRILAWLIETIAGMSYEEFIEQRILAPAGMRHSGALQPLLLVPELAAGYVPGLGASGFGPALPADITNGAGPGSLYSTVDDLARWGEQVLRDGRVLPSVHRGLLADNGLGIILDSVAGHRVVWHNGVYAGYTSLLAVFPDDSITVVYLGNTETLLSEGPLQDALLPLVLGTADPAPLRPVPIGKAPLSRPLSWYAGTYRFFPGLEVTITARDGRLLLEGLPLEHLGDGKFYYRLKGSQVGFLEGGDRSPGLSWSDPSGTYPATRLGN